MTARPRTQIPSQGVPHHCWVCSNPGSPRTHHHKSHPHLDLPVPPWSVSQKTIFSHSSSSSLSSRKGSRSDYFPGSITSWSYNLASALQSPQFWPPSDCIIQIAFINHISSFRSTRCSHTISPEPIHIVPPLRHLHENDIQQAANRLPCHEIECWKAAVSTQAYLPHGISGPYYILVSASLTAEAQLLADHFHARKPLLFAP